MTEQKKSFDDLDAVKILVEALEKFNDEEIKRIIRWSCERLGTKNVVVDGKIENKNTAVATTINEDNLGVPIRGKIVDIKSFVNSKKPTNDAQFVAVMAYYFKFEAPEDQKKEFIVSEDLNEAARLSDRKRFPKPAATLNNVYSKSGYLNRVDSGKYILNTVGENLVAMVLPDKGSESIIKNKKGRKTVKKSSKVGKKKSKN